MNCLRLLTLLLLCEIPLYSQAAEEQKGFQPFVAALHVHSRFSNGAYDVRELAGLARSRKVDVLGITDSYLTKVRYGIWPLRKLLSRSMTRDGVLTHGLDTYFKAFEQAENPDEGPVLLPGFEVAPAYYWRGQWPGSLELHDFDRHILIFGLRDRDVLQNIPVIENATLKNSKPAWFNAFGPGVLLVAGVLLAVLSGIARTRRVIRVMALCLVLGGGAWAYDGYPFGTVADPYTGKPDDEAFQRVLDYVNNNGGISFWSYPEARFGDIPMSGARMISKGRPESLAIAERYRGFEGIYGDNITITKPGNLWDQILVDYTRRGRKDWPSVITGIDFHNFQAGNAWFQLDRGLTVLFARKRNEAEILQALKLGRGYATFQRDPNHRLRLQNFALASAGNVAISGETLAAQGTVHFSAQIDWLPPTEILPTSGSAKITIVRDGRVLEEFQMPLPAVIQRQEQLEPGLHYYRIRAEVSGTEVLSNPIFCDVRLN